MSLYLLHGATEEGLIFALVTLGLLISYKILGIADMTTDGSFALGSAISALFTVAGYPLLGVVLGFLGGACAGMITATLHTLFGIPSILSGIIMMTALYSINLALQGGASAFSFKGAVVFDSIEAVVGKQYGAVVLLMLLLLALILVLMFFFKTRLGLSIRATGDNPKMVQASSINPRHTILIGLGLSNGLVALAGSLWTQSKHTADLSAGVGTVVIGLAGLVLGELFFRKKVAIVFAMISAVIGSVLYRIVLTLALRYTSNVSYLKLYSAMILAAILAYPTLKATYSRYKKFKGGKRNA